LPSKIGLGGGDLFFLILTNSQNQTLSAVNLSGVNQKTSLPAVSEILSLVHPGE
jgi:hypothetical protein